MKSIVTSTRTLDDDLKNEETKRVCWDLDLRGGVGEHILHICFLSGSTVHSALAKRLLRHFPRLIDDLYMGDEYYGSNEFIRLTLLLLLSSRRECPAYCYCQ